MCNPSHKLFFDVFCYMSCQLGSALAIGSNLLPIFQQLDIYDEFLTIAKYLTHFSCYKESLEPMRPTDLTPMEEL